MIDKEKLDKLIRNGENPKVEFKKSEFIKGQKNSELAKAMAALANHDGGKILIGVNDDKTIEGFFCEESEAKKHEERVYQIAANICDPPITPEISSIKLDEGIVFVIDILRKTGIPIRANGKFPIRHGNTTRELTHEELQKRYTNSEEKVIINDSLITSFDKLSEEQFEVRDIIYGGNIIPYIELESRKGHECTLYSRTYNHYLERTYYLETWFNEVSINKLKEILLTYYNTFINYRHYHSAFGISQSGSSWIGYGANNFLEALQNQNLRYAQMKNKYGDGIYIHHREAACFIDEIEDAIFYIHAQPSVNSNIDELTLDYFNIGFIFKDIPFNTIYNDFFKNIQNVPESLKVFDDGLTQNFPLKNITFKEEGVISTKYRNENYVSGLYGKIPKQLQKNEILGRDETIIVNLRYPHIMEKKHKYSINSIKITQIPSENFPAYILGIEGNY